MSVDTFKQSKLQYVVSLQAQGIKGDELKKRVKEWEAANQNLKGEDDAIIDPNIGETSTIDITAYKPTRYFNDDGSFNLDAFESEDGKKIAEAINNNENKKDDIKLDSNEYAVFNNDGSFNLDAFSDPSSRKAALQANLPEPDKVYDIGDVSYKMSFNDNGELVFYSKSINEDEADQIVANLPQARQECQTQAQSFFMRALEKMTAALPGFDFSTAQALTHLVAHSIMDNRNLVNNNSSEFNL